MSHKIKIAPDGPTFEALPNETILQAARRNGQTLPYECGWGSCGTCKVGLVEGSVVLIFKDAPAVSPRDARRGRILACQCRPTSDIIITPPAGEWAGMPLPCFERTAELNAVEELAPEIRRFTFRIEGGADFLPGQYAILHLPDDVRRSYSMCNLPDGETLQFIAKRYRGGVGSNALADLAPGSRITIEAPFGVCTLRRKPGRKVFVAGGTGVSPILSMISQAAQEAIDFDAPVDVIYGARTPADLAAGDELGAAIARIPHARYTPVVEAPPEGWVHQQGYVTDAITALVEAPTQAEFYVAGPPVMVNTVKVQLKEAGVPITQVHYDSFG
ncbi:2Fe-2S iron-sulfur cluster-binding protein [Labrys portucalensis]|uniref:2Fe-2S iron-sulfur cluster-binding protein n=1 Tax=Labrys neptuniae TaxID=376174 RepID=A0ABV6ZN07_9HYPH